MRPIDADKLKTSTVVVSDSKTLKWYLAVPLNVIESMPTVPAFGQWISVKDRLPENGTVVIGCSETWGVDTYMYVDETWYDGNAEDINDVTYWMPLPEPPEKQR